MTPRCPTCLALQFDGMTVELAHCAGIAIGVALAGDHPDPVAARREVEETFCQEHAALIFTGARTIADTVISAAILSWVVRGSGGRS